ncbi:hypothetical protein [Streptomyces sp. GESEQ-35]|nr:hypothetical protein [Streptomyces sp. GESEQ-35]
MTARGATDQTVAVALSSLALVGAGLATSASAAPAADNSAAGLTGVDE